MTRLDKPFIDPSTDPYRICGSLADILEQRWSSYRKALRRCRKKFSEKSVHALRVEIRRMLSMLALLQPVLPDAAITSLERELKDRLKSLSSLRDTQVQMDALSAMLNDSPELESFDKWLRRRERRFIKRVGTELAEARTGKSTRTVSELGRTLHAFAERRDEYQNPLVILVQATWQVFENVIAAYEHVGPRNIPAIHRMRTAFKKFRYMVEALASVAPGITNRQLRAMHAYQTRMGEIQDVDVLLARAEKFAHKTGLDESFLDAFRSKMLRRRERLVNRFLASADRIFTFWPPHAQRASSRKTTRLAYSTAC